MPRSLSQLRRSGFDPVQYKSKKKKLPTSSVKSGKEKKRSKAAHRCDDDDRRTDEDAGQDAAGPPSEFEIEVRFRGGLTPSQESAFETAAARWSEIIVGDLQTVQLPSGEIVDDLLIDASGTRIDGVGRILGRAAPTLVRRNGLPAAGFMEFDINDLARMESDGTLVDVIIHEMGHTLGIGTLWGSFGLVTTNCTRAANPQFFGNNAQREFADVLSVTNPLPVPVANTGGSGTRCGHWRESIFGHELMTGFVNIGPNPISRITIGSLEDMGYEVNYDAADSYALPSQRELMLLGIGDDTENQRCCGCGGGTQPAPVELPTEMHLD